MFNCCFENLLLQDFLLVRHWVQQHVIQLIHLPQKLDATYRNFYKVHDPIVYVHNLEGLLLHVAGRKSVQLRK